MVTHDLSKLIQKADEQLQTLSEYSENEEANFNTYDKKRKRKEYKIKWN